MPLSPSSLNGYEFNSQAEKEIYVVAANSTYFNNTEKYLFHSLNMAKTGDKKIKGEIDFVYMDSECILFLEVKGGSVKFDSLKNQWYVQGGTEPGDPFRQAYNTLFYTRDTLLPDLFRGKSIPGRLVYGIGVLFPDTIKPDEFRKSTMGQMEFDPELIYDYSDHKKGGLIGFLQKVKRYWSAHPQYAGRSGLSQKELSTVSRYFRQDLHFRLPVSDLLKKGSEEAQRLTGMQMYILDNLKYNPGKGGVIMGGPGTGKTLLALELFKRALTDGRRTLLICFNKNLAEYLTQQGRNLVTEGNYFICHLHSLYRDRDFLQNPPGDISSNEEYWSRDLPLQFVRNLAETKKRSFDYLIIDEGQDILNEYHFEALGLLLKGGLESGNWAIFMDKEYQNIYNNDADEYFEYLRDVYPCFVSLLQLNCRNTLSTIKRASLQTGFPEMPCLRTDQTWNSEIKFYSSDTDLKNRVSETIIKLEAEGVERKDVTILCSEREQLISLVQSNPGRYVESAFPVSGKVIVSTIHAYKGLENRFILICSPEDYNPNDKKQMSLIYIANTRATAQSIFFINSRYHSVIANRIANSN
ncbi:AAA family ATPase [Aridibaculum aurantiacum]|uniref:AAA family ATPase n=1 Tax=Aridibaculum aurantiacum TaxID=2810307 RepID=UPI001A971DED|nr:DEAD/DEAH box helicase family protein [Aridibaculum aurantiacum]